MRATVIADGRARLKEGVTHSLLFKAGLPGGEANEFTGANLQSLARDCLLQVGASVAYADKSPARKMRPFS